MEIKNKYAAPVFFILLISFLLYYTNSQKKYEKRIKGKITRLVPWSTNLHYEFYYDGKLYQGDYKGVIDRFRKCYDFGNCNGKEIWIVFDSLNPYNNNVCVECYE